MMEDKIKFSLNYEKVLKFKTIIDCFVSLMSELPFVLNQDKLTLRNMDASHVCLVDLIIEKYIFEEFNCGEEYEITVLGSNLLSILGRINKKDDCSLQLDTKNNKLKISFVGEMIRIREFILPLRTTDSGNLADPDIVLLYSFQFLPKIFGGIVSDIGLFAEAMRISLKDNKLIFEGESDNNRSRVIIDLNKENSSIIDYELGEKEEFECEYGIKYLKEILKLDNIANKVTIEVDHSKPIRFTFQIDEGFSIRVLLAPYTDIEGVD